MRKTRTWLLAGLAGAAIVGLAGMAAAQNPMHTLRVALPDGTVAIVRYAGSTPPQVTLARAPAQSLGWTPAWLGPDMGAFAAMDRAVAEMNRQTALMLRQARAMSTTPFGGDLSRVDLGALPPGSASYSFVSTATGKGVCGKSVEITSTGSGKRPSVVTRTWGDCGGAAASQPGTGTSIATPAEQSPGAVLRQTAYP